MITASLTVDRDELAARTGWELKPEGACKGDVCIPGIAAPDGPTVDLNTITEPLGMAIVHDDELGLWALGPETIGGRALATAEAPNLTLPTVDGDPFELRSLRGRKVLLVAWSPY